MLALLPLGRIASIGGGLVPLEPLVERGGRVMRSAKGTRLFLNYDYEPAMSQPDNSLVKPL
jgi:hypothetical protein